MKMLAGVTTLLLTKSESGDRGVCEYWRDASADMRRLTMGIRFEKCVVRRVRGCADV
jgi:hypothetical protein